MGNVETVSVLITDLVGSTSLAPRIGPVAAEQLGVPALGARAEAVRTGSGAAVQG